MCSLYSTHTKKCEVQLQEFAVCMLETSIKQIFISGDEANFYSIFICKKMYLVAVSWRILKMMNEELEI